MSRLLPIVCMMIIAAGCTNVTSVRPTDNSQKVAFGPGVTTNNSPSTVGVMCTGREITQATTNFVRITVGQFNDLTGKFSNEDSGYKVTQGAQHMAITSLGKFNSPNIRVLERIDTSVFTFENNLANSRLLGGGASVKYKMPDGSLVPYKPVVAGSVVSSDYYITGAITEVNFNIESGGFAPDVSNIGAGKRRYTMNVGIDMRLVKTHTLEVVKTISLQKQIVGYEWRANVFRFFGSELLDLSTGQKIDEPLQLGIRTVVEQGTSELIAFLYQIDPTKYFSAYKDQFDSNWIKYPTSVADKLCPLPTTNEKAVEK